MKDVLKSYAVGCNGTKVDFHMRAEFHSAGRSTKFGSPPRATPTPSSCDRLVPYMCPSTTLITSVFNIDTKMSTVPSTAPVTNHSQVGSMRENGMRK